MCPSAVSLLQQAQLCPEMFPLLQLHVGHLSALLKQVWVSLTFSFFGWVLTFLFCAVPIYDGRKRQLKVPDELRKIPKVLKRYITKIPQYSLALLTYTVSSYTPPSGARQDQLTANLHIQFAVVLHEPADTATASASGSKAKAGEDKKVKSEAAGSEAAGSEAAESEADESEAAESEAAESEAAESD